MDLTHIINTKKTLRFNSDGKFRILMMSDIQETPNSDGKTFEAIAKMLDALKPDLVILGGDNCDGHHIHTVDELKQYVGMVARPFEERNIPWAQIWGNHDHDVKVDEDLHQAEYMSYPNNVSSSVKGITGQSNFVLPILASSSDDVVFNVWALDSGPSSSEHVKANLNKEKVRSALRLPNPSHPNQSVWGLICFDQLMWYYNTSVEFEKQYEKKIPALLATHVSLYEAAVVTKNPVECNTDGYYPEHFDLATFNCGLFAAIIQRGDVKAVCSGHSHDNFQCGTYCGVKLCNDGSIGYNCYGEKQNKGARVFDIDESDPENIMTMHVKITEL